MGILIKEKGNDHCNTRLEVSDPVKEIHAKTTQQGSLAVAVIHLREDHGLYKEFEKVSLMQDRPTSFRSQPISGHRTRLTSVVFWAGWGLAAIAITILGFVASRGRGTNVRNVVESVPPPGATAPQNGQSPSQMVVEGERPGVASSAVESFETIVSRVMPAVVLIETSNGQGSGFFIAPDTVLTNAHVVSGNSWVTLRCSNGDNLNARAERTEQEFDIALLKVTNPRVDQATIPLGYSANVLVGQEVIAIGSPLGVLQNSVTRGIVSGLRRMGQVSLLQTDAAINPGNSGGPLIDRHGSAIGINTASFRASQGLHFSVAIDHARAAVEGRSPSSGDTGEASFGAMATLPQPRSPLTRSEQEREDGLRNFEQMLAAASQRANQLDEEWSRWKILWFEGSVNCSFSREWCAVWEANAMKGIVRTDYYRLGEGQREFANLRRQAEGIHAQVLAAEEIARKADVYPGTRRDLRHKYRLDYPGWSL